MEPVPDFDLYAELEVSRNATTPTIDAAWRSLLKRHHPDLGGPRAAERTVRLNIAHDWLTDPDRRTRYDDIRREARRERAGAAAAAATRPAGSGPAPMVGTEPRRPQPSPARPTTSGPGTSRTTGSGSPPPRPMARPKSVVSDRVRSLRGSGWRRTGWVVLVMVAAVLALVGGARVLSAIVGPGAAAPAVVGSTGPPAGSDRNALAPLATPTRGPSAGDAAGTATQPSGPRAAASPTTPVISISGGGDHGASRLQISGGTYQVDYIVSSPPGESCPWAIFLTDARGLDLLLASAYPVDETVRDSRRNAGIVAGSAAVRVESVCPHWSASISRTGP